jgi:hypothetical protein
MRYAFSSCLFGYPNATTATVGSVSFPYATYKLPVNTTHSLALRTLHVVFSKLASNMMIFRHQQLHMDTAGGLFQQQDLNVLPVLDKLDLFKIVSMPAVQIRQMLIPFFETVFLALVAGCQQMPVPGKLLSFTGSMFSTTAIVALAPGETPTSSATPNSGSPLSTGASVGIAIGVIALALFVLGFTIICCGKRRRIARLAKRQRQLSTYSDFGGGLGGLVPVTHPLNTKWTPAVRGGVAQDISPSTAGGYESDKHFTPYSSQYNSPVSARDMLNPKIAWEWKHPSVSMNAVGSSSASVGGEDGSVAAMSPGLVASVGLPGRPEAIEMEKLRDQRIEARRVKELQIRNQFLRDAEDRGFTTSNV